eukprot:TRINITY_DN13180_c0_g1_i2.p1 TRINITY_DN13180_c0_g1~~TRINITY_DN13180_c0_g1_i2.p1  ORF type:complete len:122 (-),score=6.17 TRINITY_DN13180_c0_g1_i2:56-421(-)
MTRHLISCMFRINQISRPKNSYYFSLLRDQIDPMVLSEVSRIVQEEIANKKDTKNRYTLDQIERLSFSAFEVATSREIIRSTSEETKRLLLSKFNSAFTRRKWIHALLFFVIPCERLKLEL